MAATVGGPAAMGARVAVGAVAVVFGGMVTVSAASWVPDSSSSMA